MLDLLIGGAQAQRNVKTLQKDFRCLSLYLTRDAIQAVGRQAATEECEDLRSIRDIMPGVMDRVLEPTQPLRVGHTVFDSDFWL